MVTVRRAFLWLVVLWTGCGTSDDGKQAPPDASTASDAGDDDRGLSRRRDAGTVSGDPIPTCDRFDPLACGAGEECDLVIRRAPGDENFSIYAGCVETDNERGLGEPCVPWNGLDTPYRVEGLTDEVFTDPCEQGLICAPDPDIRNHSSCQPMCQSGRFEGFPQVTCPSASQYCLPTGQNATAFEEVCVQSAQCDPGAQTGCPTGEACYLRLFETGTRVHSVCFAPPEDAKGEGEACSLINDCLPGLVCWSPTRLPPEFWTDGDLRCRRVCTPGAAGDDAGTDDDAGVGGGQCGGGLSCVDFEESGLDTSTFDSLFGLCE